MTAFIDTGSFQGIIEFSTDLDDEYRAIHDGAKIWGIYKKDGDAFIRCATVSVRATKPTPRQIYAALMAAEEKEPA